MKFTKVLVVGDELGIPVLIKTIPRECIAGILVASIRESSIPIAKKFSEDYRIPFYIQPKYNSSDYFEFVKYIEKVKFDILFCYSYSMIIREEILSLVEGNAFNVHGALLPKNRGPNPVQWSIIHGESKTGVTLHYMDTGIDSGDIVSQKEISILPEDTWISLFEKIKIASGDLINENIESVLSGTNKRFPQKKEEATINTRLNADSPLLDFKNMDNLTIYNWIRAQVSPLGGAYILRNNERIHFPNFLSLEEIEDLRGKYAD
jgi:UDP-4-amino-4-deoxy-L-arabinose formyltransferase/UDP-glucuronic acid dehydrogenase (UDP-4-keto-hexauronic acid decarboxylating)